MSEIFKTKVRHVGTSLGILIPKEITTKEKVKAGEEVQVSITKKQDIKAIEKAFGMARGKLTFKRDHNDREF